MIIGTAGGLSAAIKEAKKRTAELEELQRAYDAMKSALTEDAVDKCIASFEDTLDRIDDDIASLAREKIGAIDSMTEYIQVLAHMDERSPARAMLKLPIAERVPRTEDVVTGEIYDNATVACNLAHIHFDFRTLPPAEAWRRAKGYPLRYVR